MDPILARIYPHLPAWFFYTLVFDPVFDIDFPLSWMDFGLQLGPMLGAFWLYFQFYVEVPCWSRFFIDFWWMLDPPGTSKTKLPSRRESNFQYFIILILSSLWDSIFCSRDSTTRCGRCWLAPKTFQYRAQDGPKSFQIWGPNFNELGSGFWSQLGSNLGPN